MPESPIFVRTYDLLRWLLPRTLKFPREYRFGLVHRAQEAAFALQRALLSAALADEVELERAMLHRADVELGMLRLHVRLSHDLKLLDDKGYEHAARMLDAIGRLLGGWMRSRRPDGGTEGLS